MRAYVPRRIEAVLTRCIREFSCVVVTGPRQSGKTTLVRHVMTWGSKAATKVSERKRQEKPRKR